MGLRHENGAIDNYLLTNTPKMFRVHATHLPFTGLASEIISLILAAGIKKYSVATEK